jgi:phage terminase small subunit
MFAARPSENRPLHAAAPRPTPVGTGNPNRRRPRNAGSPYRAAVSTAPERRALFVEHYVVHRNATQAAIHAGFSPRTAKQQGSRLLTYVDVRAAIVAAERANRLVAAAQDIPVTRERIIAELARIGFANLFDFGDVDDDGHFAIDLDKVARDQAAGLIEMKVVERVRGAGGAECREREITLKLGPKLAALVSLANAIGLFRD